MDWKQDFDIDKNMKIEALVKDVVAHYIEESPRSCCRLPTVLSLALCNATSCLIMDTCCVSTWRR